MMLFEESEMVAEQPPNLWYSLPQPGHIDTPPKTCECVTAMFIHDPLPTNVNVTLFNGWTNGVGKWTVLVKTKGLDQETLMEYLGTVECPAVNVLSFELVPVVFPVREFGTYWYSLDCGGRESHFPLVFLPAPESGTQTGATQ